MLNAGLCFMANPSVRPMTMQLVTIRETNTESCLAVSKKNACSS